MYGFKEITLEVPESDEIDQNLYEKFDFSYVPDKNLETDYGLLRMKKKKCEVRIQNDE